MVGDGDDVKDPGGVPLTDKQADYGDDGNTWGGWGVGISSGGGDTGSHGTTPHNGVH